MNNLYPVDIEAEEESEVMSIYCLTRSSFSLCLFAHSCAFMLYYAEAGWDAAGGPGCQAAVRDQSG